LHSHNYTTSIQIRDIQLDEQFLSEERVNMIY